MSMLRHKEDQKENELKTQGTNIEMNSKPLKTQSSYHIGYTNEIPVTMYFDRGYINNKIEFAIDRKTWKVYFFGVYVGDIGDDGRLNLNVEDVDER